MPSSTAFGNAAAPSTPAQPPELHERELLLAGLAHDLRTPLTTIRAHSQALARGSRLGFAISPHDLRDQLMAIDDAVAEIDTLVEDLLDLVRCGAGQRLELMRRPTDLLAVVRPAVERIERSDPGRQIVVSAPDVALVGDWDSRHLGRLVTNLLTNACAHSPANRPITLRLAGEPRDGQPGVALTIEDRGCGIPLEELPRLFGPFVRGGNAAGAGWGLGLSIARQIAEQHGGRLALASAEGAGTTATLWLPLAAPPETPPPFAKDSAAGR